MFFLLLLISLTSRAGISIPRQLTAQDRQKLNEILGLGTSEKILSDPYPLGGYSGVEVGVNVESIGTEDISRMDRSGTSKKESDFTFPKFSLGKGLYNNVDLFLHFTPYAQNYGFSEYGGLVRVCLHQATFIPATFSLLIHANRTNVGNVYFSRSEGADLVAGLNVGAFAMYLGGGKVRTFGSFSQDINSSGVDETNELSQVHTFVGGTFDWNEYFVAVQIDQYTQSVYSAKVGARF